MAQFERVKQMFPRETTLDVHRCGFQITPGQRTNYLDTMTILSITVSIPHGLKFFGNMIYPQKTNSSQNFKKPLTHSRIWKKNFFFIVRVCFSS